MSRISTQRLRDFIRLLRPHFLLGSLMLFLIGSIHAGEGRINVDIGLITAILTAAMVQLAGQLADDYFDRDGDLPSKRSLFAGGSGVIQSGSFSAGSVLRLTMAVCVLSIILATAVSVFTDRWLFLPLIALGLAGGLAYSAPPIRLASTWFGELSIALLVGVVLPLTGAYYIVGAMDPGVFALCLPLFFFSLESLVAVQFPDMEADRASGKRNITLRLGIQRTKFACMAFIFMGYLAVIVEVMYGSLRAGALAILITIPISLYASWKLVMMKDYDFRISKTVSNLGMTVNGISMAILLVYVLFLEN